MRLVHTQNAGDLPAPARFPRGFGVGGMAAFAAPAHLAAGSTATPIQHVVVIFQENVSFDHYFGTYPNAANTGEPAFHARPGTPRVNGLSPALLTTTRTQSQPLRLDPSRR